MTIVLNKIEQKFLFALLTFSLLVGFLMPQTMAAEIGRAQLNGREIILSHDKTWKYATGSNGANVSSSNDDCVRIKSKTLPVSICLNEDIWKLDRAVGDAEFIFSTKDGNLYLMMVTETIEIPLKALERAIITNAQRAAGLKLIEVAVKERLDAVGLKWGRMVYTASIEGLIITYENRFTTIKGKGSVQFVFFSTPDKYKAAGSEIQKATKQITID